MNGNNVDISEEGLSSNSRFTLAAREARLKAILIDLAIVGAIALAVALLTGAISESAKPMLMITEISGATYLLINGFFLYSSAQTIGKMILKIQIARPNGIQCPFGRIISLRILAIALITMVPVIGVLFVLANPVMIFSESRRCLHDYIAGTIVTKVR